MKKASFPRDHVFLLDTVKTYFDTLFKGTLRTTNHVLVTKDVKKLVPDQNSKEIFEVDKYVLRFDHTHQVLDQKSTLSYSTYGSVFRKGFVYKNRYRQFVQYDVDYKFEDYSYFPLKLLTKFFNKDHFKIYVNHLGFLKDYLVQNQLITKEELLYEGNLYLQSKLKELSDDYTRLFVQKYPDLKDYIIAPELIRGWSYYTDLVFEIKFKDQKDSVVGGGVYLRRNIPYLGFGIGVNRLIYYLLDQKLFQTYFPPKKYVLVCFTDKIPTNFLEAINTTDIKYILKKKETTLKSLVKKIAKELTRFNIVINKIIVISTQEDEQKEYNYKRKGAKVQTYRLEELLECLSEP